MWDKVDSETHPADEQNDYAVDFEVWDRKVSKAT
jgi:hypothetical protein